MCSRATGRYDIDAVADGQRARCLDSQDKAERTHASGNFDIDAVAVVRDPAAMITILMSSACVNVPPAISTSIQ